VICDGQPLLEDGTLLRYDEAAVVEGANRSMQKVIDEFPTRHWSRRPVQEEYPLSMEAW
jgi:5-methylthioadenosine/S-adenosylhomocysteine deaminase